MDALGVWLVVGPGLTWFTVLVVVTASPLKSLYAQQFDGCS